MEGWKKNSTVNYDPESKTHRRTRILFSQELQSIPPKGQRDGRVAEMPTHTHTHTSVLSCISSTPLLLIFQALLAVARLCYLISAIAVPGRKSLHLHSEEEDLCKYQSSENHRIIVPRSSQLWPAERGGIGSKQSIKNITPELEAHDWCRCGAALHLSGDIF